MPIKWKLSKKCDWGLYRSTTTEDIFCWTLKAVWNKLLMTCYNRIRRPPILTDITLNSSDQSRLSICGWCTFISLSNSHCLPTPSTVPEICSPTRTRKRWRSWLRHCYTSRKVAGSNPGGVTGIFHWHNPSGPGVESASDRNKYQEYFLRLKAADAWGLTTLPPSCADCLEIWEPQPPGTLRACPGL